MGYETPARAFIPKISQGFDPQIADVLDFGDKPIPPHSDLLRAAVDELEPKERAVIEGLFWEGVSRREMGRRLGISRPTVTRLCATALEKLADALHTRN